MFTVDLVAGANLQRFHSIKNVELGERDTPYAVYLDGLSNQHGVHYLPIEYSKRAGKSKFNFVSDAYRYILQVLRMVMYFNPLKVLMPPALVLTGIGVLKGVVDMFLHPFYFPANTVMVFLTGMLIGSLALLADLIVRSRGD